MHCAGLVLPLPRDEETREELYAEKRFALVRAFHCTCFVVQLLRDPRTRSHGCTHTTAGAPVSPVHGPNTPAVQMYHQTLQLMNE